jgi:hypothetical protein
MHEVMGICRMRQCLSAKAALTGWAVLAAPLLRLNQPPHLGTPVFLAPSALYAGRSRDNLDIMFTFTLRVYMEQDSVKRTRLI